ncbi:hypothetical protein LMANV2_60130 [Leptospira interrogans serovar Manilae]|uniref:Uncharacterized protein n=1 Tax=Leptospira interrogans serovar Manilae TaxID=214675 RepID=A0AAQ1P3F9_LEPIR|nr:hypothetical protein LMANV2_60130 [Leptospira interrogans serovar Manilae]
MSYYSIYCRRIVDATPFFVYEVPLSFVDIATIQLSHKAKNYLTQLFNNRVIKKLISHPFLFH